jgi:hypothetical protein
MGNRVGHFGSRTFGFAGVGVGKVEAAVEEKSGGGGKCGSGLSKRWEGVEEVIDHGSVWLPSRELNPFKFRRC